MNQPTTASNNPLGNGHRYGFLLGALLLLFLVLPLFSRDSVAFTFANDLVFSIILLASVYSLCENQTHMLIAACLGVSAILMRWIYWFYVEPLLWIGSFLFAIALLMYSSYKLLVFLMRVRKVNQNTINAAICVYLSLGIAWGMSYVLLESLQPRTFTIGESAQGDTQHMVLEMIYYSMVTLTTLGYGDITPQTLLAKNLSALEAIIGQIYLTVLVARLVSLNSADTDDN